MTDLNIVDYSELSFVVQGDTRPYKEELKNIGGKWNANLRGGGGWVFSKAKGKMNDVKTLIQELKSSTGLSSVSALAPTLLRSQMLATASVSASVSASAPKGVCLALLINEVRNHFPSLSSKERLEYLLYVTNYMVTLSNNVPSGVPSGVPKKSLIEENSDSDVSDDDVPLKKML